MTASDRSLYRKILDAAVDAVGSDAGSIQVAEEGGLRLVASRGFAPASAAFWEFVETGSTTTCGLALAMAERVVASDVEKVAAFVGSDDLREWRRSGLRGMQSTPLVTSDGHVLGMLSTHWEEPHEPTDDELRSVAALARLADPRFLPRRCAWCGRFEIAGAFHGPEEFPPAELPLLCERATNGICPDCLVLTLTPADGSTSSASVRD